MVCLITETRQKGANGMEGGQVESPAKSKNAEHGDYEHVEAMAIDHSPPPSDGVALVRLVSVFCPVAAVMIVSPRGLRSLFFCSGQ